MSGPNNSVIDTVSLPEKLSDVERIHLKACELDIEKGLEGGIRAIVALEEVRANKLWREYATWGEYCLKRWNLTRQRINQLLLAKPIVEEVKTSTAVSLDERQARELRKAEPDDRIPIIKKLQADEVEITGPTIRAAVAARNAELAAARKAEADAAEDALWTTNEDGERERVWEDDISRMVNTTAPALAEYMETVYEKYDSIDDAPATMQLTACEIGGDHLRRTAKLTANHHAFSLINRRLGQVITLSHKIDTGILDAVASDDEKRKAAEWKEHLGNVCRAAEWVVENFTARAVELPTSITTWRRKNGGVNGGNGAIEMVVVIGEVDDEDRDSIWADNDDWDHGTGDDGE